LQAVADGSANVLRFYDGTAASERMRIDSSGNLLVGKTAQGLTNAGFEVAQSGQASATQSGASALRLNRLSSDGEILQFRKDGSTVGNIGTQGGDLWVGTGNTGAYFWDGSNAIAPWNTSTNTTRDAAINLGTSSVRWQNLYLSGGVYLGGVGSSNLLEDYEEGTFTISLKGSTTNPSTAQTWTSYYTKVGRNVTVFIPASTLLNSTGASGNVYFDGLPFAATIPTTGTVMSYNGGSWSGSDIVSYTSGSSIYLYQNTSGGVWSSVTHIPSSSVYYVINATYFTS